MRDPKRIEPLLAAIRMAMHTFPDMRLGQLLHNATDMRDLFYIEDEQLATLVAAYAKRRLDVIGEEGDDNG